MLHNIEKILLLKLIAQLTFEGEIWVFIWVVYDASLVAQKMQVGLNEWKTRSNENKFMFYGLILTTKKSLKHS